MLLACSQSRGGLSLKYVSSTVWAVLAGLTLAGCANGPTKAEHARETRLQAMAAYYVDQGKSADSGRCVGEVLEEHLDPIVYADLIESLKTPGTGMDLSEEPDMWTTSFEDAQTDLYACSRKYD